MFTGIIEATAEILKNEGHRLIIERPNMFDDIKLGSSISVSGVCLSIVSFDDDSMSFDVVDETLSKTKLGSLKASDRVNLERSMRADSRLDGHVVQGHVEGVGIVRECKMQNVECRMKIEIPNSLLPSVVSKGSIAIDGISLTVATLEHNLCTIAVIPHTLSITTLANLKEKDLVNIETDILARYNTHSPKNL